MKKIEKLTVKQTILLEKMRKDALEIGYSTEQIDKRSVEQVITYFYSRIGKKPPLIFYSWSPLGNCIFPIYLEANLGANLEANLWRHWHWGVMIYHG